MKEHQVYELHDKDVVELKIKKKFPYNKMVEILLSGNTFFLPVDRRTATYVRGRLEKMLDEFVETTLASYKVTEGEKLEGYVFSFKLAKEYFERNVIENGTQPRS